MQQGGGGGRELRRVGRAATAVGGGAARRLGATCVGTHLDIVTAGAVERDGDLLGGLRLLLRELRHLAEERLG